MVDDNEFNIISVRLLLQDKYDLEIDTATNGEIAVNMYDERLKRDCWCPNRVYKVIIMDIGMPVMNGIEAATRITELQSGVENGETLTNIVALTSFTNEKVRKDCITAGMKEVYNKPLQSDTLKELMDKYFP